MGETSWSRATRNRGLPDYTPAARFTNIDRGGSPLQQPVEEAPYRSLTTSRRVAPQVSLTGSDRRIGGRAAEVVFVTPSSHSSRSTVARACGGAQPPLLLVRHGEPFMPHPDTPGASSRDRGSRSADEMESRSPLARAPRDVLVERDGWAARRGVGTVRHGQRVDKSRTAVGRRHPLDRQAAAPRLADALAHGVREARNSASKSPPSGARA